MTLYVVATPIGNLGDITHRALDVLRDVSAVVAEDTRHSRALLTHFDIHKPLLSLPAFDERERIGPIVERLVSGESLALVTDAGTPAVSDPGEALVAGAWSAGVKVVPIPGPSAVLAALSASGLVSSRFAFFGFLPRGGQARRDAIESIRRLPLTVVVFEAGNRTGATLADLAASLGNRRALLARELTKLHEELVRAPLGELAVRFRESVRGEVALVIEAGSEVENAADLPPIEDAIRARLAAGLHVREIAQALADEYRLPRQQVYSMVLRAKDHL